MGCQTGNFGSGSGEKEIVMESKQYRISKVVNKQYQLQVTFGLLDVKVLGVFDKRVFARQVALKHAELSGWKAIILY